jgi:hypothetical protein
MESYARRADGIEVATADTASWEEAMATFNRGRAAEPRKANPLASLSLHALRLHPTEKTRNDPTT